MMKQLPITNYELLLAARTIAPNSFGFRLAPPTSAPSISGCAIRSAALAALRVAHDDVLAHAGQHGRRHFARKGSGFFPMHVLRAQADTGGGHQRRNSRERHEGGTDDALDRGVGPNLLQQIARQVERIRNSLVHFPVSSNDRMKHQATPLAL